LISALVITRNEETNIQACLASLAWADETIVLDCFSDDATVGISREMGAKVHQRTFTTYANQRNAAIDLASGDWVFFLDADERVPEALREEVLRAVSSSAALTGYWIPRQNIILGRWMRHAGWYPDYQLRLFRRSAGRYDESRDPHELLVLEGEQGYLSTTILHYNYDTLGQLFAKQRSYATRQAQTMRSQGVKAKPQNFVLQPFREFRRRYLQQEGYKDGLHGLFLSLVMAWYEMRVYMSLARLSNR